jgi:predicted nucleic acid-binding protein
VRLLVSDKNILMDWEAAGRLPTLFGWGATLVVPDVLFAQELTSRADRLTRLGLLVLELDERGVRRSQQLVPQYVRLSTNDISALVLAERQVCPLLTGDKALRAAATREGVVVHGTLWLAEEMFKAGVVDVPALKAAFEEMLRRGRRLPVADIEALLTRLSPPPHP